MSSPLIFELNSRRGVGCYYPSYSSNGKPRYFALEANRHTTQNLLLDAHRVGLSLSHAPSPIASLKRREVWGPQTTGAIWVGPPLFPQGNTIPPAQTEPELKPNTVEQSQEASALEKALEHLNSVNSKKRKYRDEDPDTLSLEIPGAFAQDPDSGVEVGQTTVAVSGNRSILVH